MGGGRVNHNFSSVLDESHKWPLRNVGGSSPSQTHPGLAPPHQCMRLTSKPDCVMFSFFMKRELTVHVGVVKERFANIRDQYRKSLVKIIII
jgi:hypothetical protein